MGVGYGGCGDRVGVGVGLWGYGGCGGRVGVGVGWVWGCYGECGVWR